MAADITIQAPAGFAKYLAELGARGFPVRAMRPLASGIERASLEVVGAAVKTRFSGKGPFPVSQNKLGVVSGRLRRSIRATKPQINFRTGELSVGFGSNVVYFAPHEFGSTARVQVRGHSRRAVAQKLNSRGRPTKSTISRRKASLRAGTPSTGHVRPHHRKQNTPARRPLGTQLADPSTSAAFMRRMSAALRAALTL